jgi:hypothetical protein
MRSARRNIGERWANPSSSPAAGGPDDRWRMEAGGRGSAKFPFLLGEQLTCDDSSRH